MFTFAKDNGDVALQIIFYLSFFDFFVLLTLFFVHEMKPNP